MTRAILRKLEVRRRHGTYDAFAVPRNPITPSDAE
jgi:hypothetical protein